MKSVPHNLIRDKVYCVNYIEYIGESGAKEHFYIAVRQEDMAQFKQVIRQGNFDAEDYGLVLEQGIGSASPSVRDRMKMLYKCDQ